MEKLKTANYPQDQSQPYLHEAKSFKNHLINGLAIAGGVALSLTGVGMMFGLPLIGVGSYCAFKGISSRKMIAFLTNFSIPERELLQKMQDPKIKDKAAKNLGCALENKIMQSDGSVKNNHGALESINHAKEISDTKLQGINTTADIKRLFGGTQILADLDGRINLELIVDGKTLAITNETGTNEVTTADFEIKKREQNLQILIEYVDRIAQQTGISKENIWRAIFMIPGQSLAGSFNELFKAGIDSDGYTTDPRNSQSTLTLSFNKDGTIQARYDTTEPINHAHDLRSDQVQMAAIETAVLSLNTKANTLEYKPVYKESKMSLHATDIDESGNITKLHKTPLLEIHETQAPEVKQIIKESIVADLENVKSQVPHLESKHISDANKIIDLVIEALKQEKNDVVIPEDINIPVYFSHTDRTMSIVDAVELAQICISEHKSELQRQKDTNSNTLTSTVLAFGAIITTIKEFQQQNDLS